MDTTRLAALIGLAVGALVDILIAVYLILVGALDAAAKNPLHPKAFAVLFLIAACFVAPPIALSYFRKNNYLYAFIAILAPMTLTAIASRFGL